MVAVNPQRTNTPTAAKRNMLLIDQLANKRLLTRNIPTSAATLKLHK